MIDSCIVPYSKSEGFPSSATLILAHIGWLVVGWLAALFSSSQGICLRLLPVWTRPFRSEQKIKNTSLLYLNILGMAVHRPNIAVHHQPKLCSGRPGFCAATPPRACRVRKFVMHVQVGICQRIFGGCIGRGLCVDFTLAALWKGFHHGE